MSVTSKGSGLNLEGYDILEEIGRGSYANVFKAVNKETTELVAIKRVEKSKLSPSGQDNIIREITLLKDVLHDKFIVEMKDFSWDEKFIYIILEYCDGGDLSKFIKKRQRLPEKVCKRFMQQLSLGLKFLRSKNICHFDLKPSNLLLVTEPTMSIKIADFGFANFLSDDALNGTIRGTPLYMAPEVLLHRNFNVKTDLWSVGIIMYECLLGKPPFTTTSCKQLLIDIKNQVPIEVRTGLLSYHCEDLLKRLLDYNFKNRISYEEFFAHPFLDLEHFPDDSAYIKAVQLAREAVKLDNNKEYLEAFNKYCEVLKYLIPFLSEVDALKREQIRSKILEYTKRADNLKIILHKARDAFITRPERPDSQESLQNRGKSLMEIALSKFDVKELKTMCASTPKMLDGIDIGYTAQMYMYEGKYDIALEKFKACFGVLIPLLNEEPDGVRKKILSKLVDEWMKQAESVQMLTEANLKESAYELQKDSCSIQ